jgi:hypothetical protein
VQKLGDIKSFLKKFETNYSFLKDESYSNNLNLIQFKYKRRTHLVSMNNLVKNYEKIIDNKNHYKFYSLSMVLLGGLGPQGHGFTYSTPRGEIVEICSDVKENEAIIVKYKQFLKQQFLTNLKEEMNYRSIEDSIAQEVITYLSETLNNKELINYYKKEKIEKQITSFLYKNLESFYENEPEFFKLLERISNSIENILRPIKMVDQFKTRMLLVNNNKIKSEDIAKLTSLKNKSHYDVLRERFFFQNEIKWFYKDYAEELLKFSNKMI